MNNDLALCKVYFLLGGLMSDVRDTDQYKGLEKKVEALKDTLDEYVQGMGIVVQPVSIPSAWTTPAKPEDWTVRALGGEEKE